MKYDQKWSWNTFFSNVLMYTEDVCDVTAKGAKQV